MESFRKEWTDHPREKSNPLAVLFFTWVYRVFREDRKKVITTENIWGPYSKHKTNLLGDRLEKAWIKQLEKKSSGKMKKSEKPSLVVAIGWAFWLDLITISVLHLITQLLDVLLRPTILAQMVQSFTEGVKDPLQTSLLALQMLAVTSFISLMNNHYLLLTGTLGMKMRAAVVSVVYRKSLKLSKATLREVSPGQIVNLVSNDVGRFEQVNICINFLWSAPMQTVIVAILLYLDLGVLGFSGMIIIAAVAILQTYTAELTSRFRRKIARECDRRITLTDEILAGINVIKMYAWEKPFLNFLSTARKAELKYVRLANMVRGLYMTFNITTTRVALFITIATYVLSGNQLTAAEIFKIGSYYGILAQTMASIFVRGVQEVAECRVSLRRLQNYLLQDEVENQIQTRESKNDIEKGILTNGDVYGLMGHAITVKDVQASWMKDPSASTDLKDLSFTVRRTHLVGVIGSVGSGKSSLLQLLLGELNISSGSVAANGEISYASQEPWIFGGTVRDNILLGLPYNRIRYRQVIEVCSLTRDLDLFPHRDQTMVGERGASLSGGQRARINLARAIYKEADIYLLDDPLSAVDAHVAKALFNRCIKVGLREVTTTRLDYEKLDKLLLSEDRRAFYSIEDANVAITLLTGSLNQAIEISTSIVCHEDQIRRWLREMEEVDERGKPPDFYSDSDDSKSDDGSFHEEELVTQQDLSDAENEDSGEAEVTSIRKTTHAASRIVPTYLGKDNTLTGFLKGRTVLLATHQLQFLGQTDQVIYLQQGMIRDIGSFNELMSQGHDFTKIIEEQSITEGGEPTEQIEPQRKLSRMISEQRMSFSTSIEDVSSIIDAREIVEEQQEEEDRSQNEKYKGHVLYDYLKTGGARFLFSVFIIFAFFAQFFASATDMWMSQWAKQLDKEANGTGEPESVSIGVVEDLPSTDFYVIVYGSLILFTFISAILRGITFVFSCIKCSKRIHSNMVKSALYTDVQYFNDNPSGAILNKFSRDLGSTDELLPKGMLDMCQTFGMVAGAVVNTIIVNYYLLIPTMGFLVVTIIIRQYCLRTSLNLKRNENISRGPVYTHLNTCLQGLTTIRAHGSQDYLNNAFNLHLDLNTSCYYSYLAVTQAYSYCLDVVSSLYLGIVIYSCIFWNAGLSGAEVGLAITQTMQITGMLQWGMRMSSEVANIMTSVERLLLFLRLAPEENDDDEKLSPPPNWPNDGNIAFHELSLSFTKSSPPVLKNVSVKINAGEKVAIVGRTGAGKSSLSTALFRLAPTDGHIFIDGVDTKTIPLRTLRSALAIIPQNPILFSGDLRKNLDPIGDYPDYQLWKALEDVDTESILKGGHGLDTKINDGGSNMSVGQRQLICLARAVVKERKIIVLDEATASVDPETDAVIQATIRKKFADCTVLTIAHRLNTIMDSDRILVMDAGQAVELDSPYNLLQAKGYFYSLVQETGTQMAAKLTEQVRERHMSTLAVDDDNEDSTI